MTTKSTMKSVYIRKVGYFMHWDMKSRLRGKRHRTYLKKVALKEENINDPLEFN